MIGTKAFGSKHIFRISTIYKQMDDIGLEIAGLGKECSERRMDDLLRQQQEFKVRRSVTFRVTFRDALQPNIASFANHSAVLLLLLVSLQNFSTPQLSLT